MTTIPSKCSRRHSDAIFEVYEVRSKVIFINERCRQVDQIEVDGCVFKSEGQKRCDWLVNVDETDTSIFVELKGSDIDAAFEQLAAAQGALSTEANRRIYWIVSYSGSPRFQTSEARLTIIAKQRYRARLRIEDSPFEMNV